MEEIKVGEYVRIVKGKIDIFKEKDENCMFARCEKNTYWMPDIVKHSKNIIDLIECGDYVNGMEILDIYIPRDKWDPIELRVDSRYTNFILADEIKTILTKEQFEQNLYKV